MALSDPTQDNVGATDEDRPVFEIRDDRIDVDSVIDRVRERVEEKRREGVYGDGPWLRPTPDFTERHADAGRLTDRLEMLKMGARIDLESEPITSHRRVTGLVIVWLKQWSRFLIRRYTDSILYRQNHLNAEVADLLTDLTREVEQLTLRVEALEKEKEGTTADRVDSHL